MGTMIIMLEQETHNIIRTLTDRAIGSAQSLALKDALMADLPKNIKLYLQCEVTGWLQSDLRNANHFSNVRFATPSVQQLTKTFMRALASEYVFTREEFSRTLENAVHFVENYLCRPQWMLEQFIFEKSGKVTTVELLEKFEYLSDYLYYRKLIQGYVQQKGLQEIAVGDFRTLISRFDDEIVKRHSPGELAQLTRPIFDFLLLQSDKRSIPIRPLIVFFEDKKMTAVKEYIERVCHMRKSNELTIEGLSGIIVDMQAGTPPQASTPPASEPEQEPEQTSGDPHVVQPDITNTEALVQKPAVKQQLPSDADPTHETGRSDPAMRPHQSAPSQGADRRNIALSLTFSGMTGATRSSASPPPDLKTVISEEQRERFINAVFQKDEAYYEVVVESLNDMTSWKDAALYLQTFYQTTGVDLFSQDVIEFTDLIQNHFESTEQL